MIVDKAATCRARLKSHISHIKPDKRLILACKNPSAFWICGIRFWKIRAIEFAQICIAHVIATMWSRSFFKGWIYASLIDIFMKLFEPALGCRTKRFSLTDRARTDRLSPCIGNEILMFRSRCTGDCTNPFDHFRDFDVNAWATFTSTAGTPADNAIQDPSFILFILIALRFFLDEIGRDLVLWDISTPLWFHLICLEFSFSFWPSTRRIWACELACHRSTRIPWISFGDLKS